MARILLLAALLVAFGARAEEMKVEARKHQQAGLAATEAKKYKTAIKELQKAIKIDPQPQLYYELGQAQVLAQQPRDAAASFHKYLELKPDAPEAEDLRPEISALEQQALDAEIKATPPPKLAPAPPPEERAEPTGPPPSMLAPRPAPPPEEGEQRSQNTPLPAVPHEALPQPAAEEEQGSSSHWPVWVGIGVVAAVGATVGILIATEKHPVEPTTTVDAR